MLTSLSFWRQRFRLWLRPAAHVHAAHVGRARASRAGVSGCGGWPLFISRATVEAVCGGSFCASGLARSLRRRGSEPGVLVNDRRGSGKGATDPVSSARSAFAASACPCACVLRVCVLSAISAARLWGRGVLRPLPPGTLSTRTAQAPATASICVASAPPSCQSVCAMHACVAGAATACRRCGLPARAAHCTI